MGFLIRFRERLKGSRAAQAAEALKASGIPRPQAAISVDEVGLGVVRDPLDPESFTPLFSWAEVNRVVAFKRDLFMEDLLCLRFETSAGSAHEVNEELAGWDELLDQLPERLPGCLSKDTILALVALPAFAANATVAFERGA
jgi:hypothetical protein